MLGGQPTDEDDDSTDEGENDDAAATAIIVFLGRSGASWWAPVDGGFALTIFPVAILATPRLGLAIRPRRKLRLRSKPVALGLLALGWGFPHGIGFAVAEAKGKRRLITVRRPKP